MTEIPGAEAAAARAAAASWTECIDLDPAEIHAITRAATTT
jgi:hypothetical protein